ncbi:MAG: glycosyl hydrolase [Bacteroidales bacterium]
MKTRIFLTLILLLLIQNSYAQKPADKSATGETMDLYNRISELTKKGIMIGHQDALAYGHAWKLQGNPDIRQLTGDYPAVFGWELGDLELNHQYSLDSVAFDKIREGIKWVYKNKGINTISWHCNNPLTGGNAWDVSSAEVVKSILPGGSRNAEFNKMLDRVADFLNSLKDENGIGIPVLFRPWHEHTGSWFWWGKKLCTVTDYVALWKYTIEYFQTHGVHNVIYIYSSSSNIAKETDYLERYPGDDYIDIFGFDIYQQSLEGRNKYLNEMDKCLDIITNLAQKRNKVATISETGFESIPDKKWWTETLWPGIEKYAVSYVLLWRNACNAPKHYFAPFPGQESADDFIELYKRGRILFLNEIQKE